MVISGKIGPSIGLEITMVLTFWLDFSDSHCLIGACNDVHKIILELNVVTCLPFRN